MAKKPPPGGLNVVPETATIKVGVTQYVFCSDPAALWSSSNPAIALVDDLVRGAVLGVSAGVATITAKHRNKKGSMTITVEAIPDPPPVDPATYGPQADVTQPPGSVQILPGVSSIQAVIDAHPAGSTYWIRAGTYPLLAPLHPKSGDVLVGEYGAILDGTAVDQAFDPAGIAVVSGWNRDVAGVTVRNLVILGRDRISGVGAYGPNAGGWTVDQCEIARCRWGVNFGRYWSGPAASKVYVAGPTITGNRIRDCLWSGASSEDGSGPYGFQNTDGTVMARNEITASGAQPKFTGCIRSLVEANYCHDGAVGIWFDGDNLETTIQDNTIEDHANEGIMCEISAGITIRRNTVRRSGQSGIFISTTRQVTITENVLEANWRDVNLFVYVPNVRPADDPYPGAIGWDLADITVSGNTFTAGTRLETITAGLSGSGGDLSPYLDGTKSIHFTGNQYRVPTAGSWWYWNTFHTWAEWQAIPQDADGTLIVG